MFSLALYINNVAGYFVFQFLKDQSDLTVIEQLDSHHYLQACLREIKIPLHTAYSADQSSYQRVDGTIIINGICYNSVLQRIRRDSLSILYLPNKVSTRLLKAARLYSSADDLTGKPVKGSGASAKNKTIKNHYRQCSSEFSSLPAERATGFFCYRSAGLADAFLNTPFRPPILS